MADIFTDKTPCIGTTRWPCGPINPQFTVPAVFRECQSLESQLHWLVGWLNHLASIDPDKLNDVIDSIDATLEDHETRITNNTTNIANTRASIIIDNRSMSFTAAALDALVGTGVSGLTPTPGAKVNDTLIEVRTCTDTGKPSALIGRVTAVASTSMTYLVLVALHDDYATLKSQIDGVDGDVTNLTTRVTKNEGDITNLTSRVTTVEGDVTNLEAKVEGNTTSITNLGDRVTNVEGDVTNMTDKAVTIFNATVGIGSFPAVGNSITISDGNYGYYGSFSFKDVVLRGPIFIDARLSANANEKAFIIGRVESIDSDSSRLTVKVDIVIPYATMDYVTNAIESIVNKVFGGGTISADGTITWPNTNPIPTGNLNIYSQDTDPTSGAQIAIKTHNNPNNSDLWFK